MLAAPPTDSMACLSLGPSAVAVMTGEQAAVREHDQALLLQQAAERFVLAARQLCVFCPPALLGTVLDGVLRPVLVSCPGLTASRGRAAVRAAAGGAALASSAGLRLGVMALEAAAAVGPGGSAGLDVVVRGLNQDAAAAASFLSRAKQQQQQQQQQAEDGEEELPAAAKQ